MYVQNNTFRLSAYAAWYIIYIDTFNPAERRMKKKKKKKKKSNDNNNTQGKHIIHIMHEGLGRGGMMYVCMYLGEGNIC